MISDNNYYIVSGWMLNKLNLKGNELDIYAIIYGFSQDGSAFEGSLQYLADWTNSTRQGVIKNIKSLLDKGLIKREAAKINGKDGYKYYALFGTGKQSLPVNKVHATGKQSSHDQSTKFTSTGKQSLHNNDNNNYNDNEIIKKEKNNNKGGFDSIIEEYTQDENLKQTIVDFIGMRKAIKHQMTDKALKMMLTKLDGLSSTVDGKIKILEQSIFHSWQGVFPLKEEPEEQQTGDGIKWQ